MGTSVERLAEALQDAEIVVLRALAKQSLDLEDLYKKTLLNKDAVSRACLWLQNKALVEVKETPQTFVALEKLGEQYATEGLPEKRFLQVLKDKELYLDELATVAKLNKQEATYSLGHWKKHAAISFLDGKVKLIKPQLLQQKLYQEILLEKLAKEKETELINLRPEEKQAFEELRPRGIVKKVERKIREFSITDLGKKVVTAIKDGTRIGTLTSEIIKAGTWRNSSFRRYDIQAQVPKIYPGKKQAYRAFLDEVKAELTNLGFEEMAGPIVELAFFNNDALYMPQDHPARGIHDVYFVKEPKYGNLQKHQKYLSEVKKVHESGGKAGSTGWQIPFDIKDSARLILRSQTTALSARMLSSADLKTPGAYFAIARCFRPEKLDPTHLMEFDQCEGIVLGDKVNFKNLLGLLKQFAVKFTGTDKIKFKPGYFPFTEPSVEAAVWSKEQNKWLEILGAGIFRPEVTEPFGVKVPVLAWGIGIGRLFMIKNNISDIRQLYSQDIEYLREAKI